MHHKKRLLVLLLLFSTLFLGFRQYDSVRRFLRMTYGLATTAKEQVIYSGPVKATPPGKTAIGVSTQSLSADTQMILFLGRLIVKGKITPAAPGSAIPTKLRITVKHNSAGGKTLSAANYDVNVQSDGTILQQNLAVSDFEVFQLKDTLQLLVIPVDRALPAGRLTFSATHSLGAVAAENESPSDVITAATPQCVYVYTNYVEDRALNGTLGPYTVKVLGQPAFNLNGTLRINGKITPFDPEPIPASLSVTVKHKDARNGNLLSTQTFTVKVQPNGQILIQPFPITTTNATSTPESLEVTAKPVGKAFPYSLVNVRMTYTPAT